MRALFFIFLASYAVKCDDDASYYVVEIPEQSRQEPKPFRVYWNVPTMQCKSKKIPFEDLYDRFGIIQNTGDSFRGNEVAILYDPGVFPALLKNETSGKFKFRNGGVPQEGDLEKHWNAFRKVLEQSIPDPDFSGIGIIDFESWRPIFRQNFGVLAPYKDFSYQIERKLHWFWPEKAIQARAKQRFEEAARSFMQTTLVIAREMRPLALWGYYAFPYCFNTIGGSSGETCSTTVQQENDKIGWLWHSSTALYPSTYVSRGTSLSQLRGLLRGRVAEAARVSRHAPVLPYFWFRYREGGFLSQDEINVVLDTFYKSSASGFIIWGSSNDVNTVDKCKKLFKYTEEILGPSIAKYTKLQGEISSNKVRPITQPSNSDITTWRPILKDQLSNNNNKTNAPESIQYIYQPWFALENNTQDIIHKAEQTIKNTDNTSNKNSTNLLHIKKNTLLELLFNILLYKEITKDNENENDDYDVSNEMLPNTGTNQSSYLNSSPTELNFLTNNATTVITPPIIRYTTLNPLNVTIHNIDKNYTFMETQIGTIDATTEKNQKNNETLYSNVNSSENITIMRFTNTLDNQISVTTESTIYEDNTVEAIKDETKIEGFNSTEESDSGKDLVTEIVTETNIIIKEIYASLENITTSVENNSNSQSSFNFNETTTSTNNLTTYTTTDHYLPSESDSRTTSNLSIFTSTNRSDGLIEVSDIIMQTKDEKQGYYFRDKNDSITSKDNPIIPLHIDQITTKDLLLESTTSLEIDVETDYFTATEASSTARTEIVSEPVIQLDDKFDIENDIGNDNYEELESISEQQLYSTEFPKIFDNKFKKISKNITNIFHKDIEPSESTTDNYYTFHDSEDLLDKSDSDAARSSDETTDSVRRLAF